MADKEKEKKKNVKEQKGKKKKGGEPKASAKGKDKKQKQETPAVPKDYIPRILDRYRKKTVPELQKQFNYQNPLLLPKLDKIVLNVGMGTLHQDAKLSESIVEEMTIISGQKPVLTKARLSVSNFKLRQGMVVGCRVTLRKVKMYEFFDRLISIVIPRIRDFRGLDDKSFDGHGNYTFGIKEQIIFPEIDYDKIAQIHGMDITICTSAQTDEEALALLSVLGFPFRRRTPKPEAA